MYPQRKSFRGWYLAGLLLVGSTGAFALWHRLVVPVTVIPGNAVRFDDFDFTVRTGRVIPCDDGKGQQYEIDVVVHNGAGMVAYKFKPSTIALVSSDDTELTPMTLAVSENTLEAGETRTFPLRFTGAVGLQEAGVEFRFGGQVGNTLDRLLMGRIRVPVVFDPMQAQTRDDKQKLAEGHR